MAKALNISTGCIYSYFRKYPNNTLNDAIDYYLDKNQYVEYKGIRYIKDNKRSLAKALNVSLSTLRGYLYNHSNSTFNDAIDYYLSK